MVDPIQRWDSKGPRVSNICYRSKISHQVFTIFNLQINSFYMVFKILRIRNLSGLFHGTLLMGLMAGGASCEKTPGTGGTGSITGTIYEQFYNDDFSSQIYQRPAVDEEVFILFGDDHQLGDRTFTTVGGVFAFDFLYPGHYSLYFMSEDSAAELPLETERVYTVELERGEHRDLGILRKLTVLDYDDGSAVIKGVVREIKYVDGSSWPDLVIENIDYAMEQEVYLVYGEHAFYDERIRTQYNGYFEFSHLIPGHYQVFLYSEDVTGETERVPLKFEVTITGFEQVVDLGEITIEKL